MAIVGSFQDGLLHDPSILISKAVMDFVIVMVFASTLGVGTIFPQFLSLFIKDY